MFLAAGVAALAIAAPASAGPHGGGGGHGNGGGPPAAKAQGGGGSGGGHGQQARPNRGGGGGGEFRAQARPNRGGGEFRAQARQNRGGGEFRARGNPNHGGEMRAQARPNRGGERAALRAQARENRGVQMRAMKQAQNARAQERANARTAERIRGNQNKQAAREMARRGQALGRNNAPVMAVRENQRIPLGVRGVEGVNVAQTLGYGIGGCPPGLAKKPVACMPPGQAKQLIGAPLATAARVAALNELPVRLQSLYSPTPDYYYRYGDGYLYQVDRSNDVISSLLPLFGLGYTVGQPFPSAYPYYGMPAAYQPFYPSSPYYDYRYADGYMYQVDPYTGLIENVDPLLGYGYGYGQPMPLQYSAYNVPYQYRPYYYDTSDYYYRYAPGAIYQVDPTTSLITAVAALLSPNSLGVGQPLPIGYSAYNVPYDYRATYYDTPNDWYRYSNGYIYRVDPATQLVTALVASALT
jgi:hypothetical protein